jgi:two-component system OmpR family sensor kinase/two-component system sensor histidine kinase BaeS
MRPGGCSPFKRRGDFTPAHRFVLWRFVALTSALLVLFVAALGATLFLTWEPGRELNRPPHGWAPAACCVPLAFLLVMTPLVGWMFRRVGTPLADIMAAVEAMAKGDLSARVPEQAPGEFGRLARRFNHMATELERAEQQRRNLTADVAHELRTPLHIIQGNLEGVLDGVYAPTPEHIGATLEETHRLARLVSDLQTLSLAEAGQLPLHPEKCLAADVLADVAEGFAGQAAEQEVALRVEPQEEGGLELYADPDRLNQVLSNLVANALRYTPAGGHISLGAVGVPGGVRLTVTDTGAGIAPEDLPYIFDRFWRGDRARSRQAGSSSGLGLAIARQLVQAQGGTIRVESQVGTGTKFTIEFPLG